MQSVVIQKSVFAKLDLFRSNACSFATSNDSHAFKDTPARRFIWILLKHIRPFRIVAAYTFLDKFVCSQRVNNLAHNKPSTLASQQH